ncbi:MAG TPA: membrane protein insertase YidC [Terriglobia bacterium]|nr:membrane protein insertase YidC [Terriglobia bacterium]
MKSDETKRLIIAFAITFLIVVLWRPLISRFTGPEPTSEPATGQSSGSATNPSPNVPSGAPPASSAVQPPPAPVSAPIRGKRAQEIVVESDDYQITLSTEGAVVKSWVLKKYRDANDRPLDLVNQEACEQLGFPMSVSLPDSGLAGKVNGALYAVQGAAGGTIRAPAKLQFTYSDGQTQVQKSFSFGDGYQIDVKVGAFDSRGYMPAGILWPGGFGDYSLGPKTVSTNSEAVYDVNGDVTKVKESKAKGSEAATGPVAYAGLEDHYFIDILIPRSSDAVFRLSRRSYRPTNWTEKELPSPLQAELASAGGQPIEFGLVVAPKDLDLLHAMKPPLDGLVEFGIFSVLAKPLFLAMRYVYDHWVHNYGWAIIILTLVINVALFPLKLRSIHSAQKMQRVAPRVKRIQEQYKQYKLNDPRKQKMNEEVMKLYKEEGINPLGGCLPMVLQLPFLYAIYEVLGTVIEMRHAPWLGCIKDLAAPDSCHPFGIPFPLLPTLMIISMFVMQKMTPMATTDPNQQRMMYIMPLMFGVIFYRLASGLVLYYMAANLVGIAQQLIINRFIPVATPGGGAPPADVKAAGDPSAKALNRRAPRKPVSVKN